MTPDDIDKLTIAEVRAICDRATAALSTLRELGLMGGAATASTSKTSPNADVAPPALGPATRVRTPLSDAELAEMTARKQALLVQNLPEELQRAERTPPP